MSGVTYRSRVRGCVLGGAIGDALGGAIEFDSIGGVRSHHGGAGVTGMVADAGGREGLITDDTQMTLFTLEGLIRAGLREATRGVRGHAVGGAVRVPTGYYAAGAFAAIVHQVADDLTLYEAVHETLRLLDSYPGHEETSVALRAADELVGKGEPSPERVESLGGGWVAEEALAIAVYCALAYEKDFPAALLLAVNHSGDSDSTGSMAGNLLGAVHGEDVLPESWLDVLEGRGTIAELADDFAGRGRTDPAKYPPG
ncbi:ADP-ribosylglycohydrolase family protein [Nonomuraea sp. ZG12]|uniref:ADP-ribosylglycohydrolase family protein n=1 Tax=Nonomuraea sp. ZG12 TaxID=3452207 RepID=UPI003F89B795